MRVAFAGTPEFAATILHGLAESDHEVELVISQPDSRKGRGRRSTPTAVVETAHSIGLPLRQPERISEAVTEISKCDALVVAAYGQILRTETLYAARFGSWNVHASLLPAYRGAAPIERAIMAGERETGVTIMKMDEGLDTGPIALQLPIPITPDMTGGELTKALASLGAKAIVEGLSSLEEQRLTLSEQDSLYATHASKVEREDQVIRWGWRAGEVHDHVRALAPHIGARAYHEAFDGPIKIWRTARVTESGETRGAGNISAANGRILVSCGEGSVEILELQAPGGRRLSAGDFLRGNALGGQFIG